VAHVGCTKHFSHRICQRCMNLNNRDFNWCIYVLCMPVEWPESKITWKMLNQTCEVAPWLYTVPMSHPNLEVALWLLTVTMRYETYELALWLLSAAMSRTYY
jgi:hypothetical protein